jgi:hypothetical protein
MAKLAIVGVYWNPFRHPRLERNFEVWHKKLPRHPDVELWLGEVVRPGQTPKLAPGPRTVHYTLEDHIWCIESARNALIEGHIRGVDAVVCMDTDLIFARQDWWRVVLESLEQFPIIQPFKTGVWLDERGCAGQTRRSLGAAYAKGNAHPWPERLGMLHTGFAWAARRSLWDAVKPGMPDWVCTGPNDRAIALACTGHRHPSLHGWWEERLNDYCAELRLWMGRETFGYAPLEIVHQWHGGVKKRRYEERAERLHQINWPRDCCYTSEGLLAWTQTGRELHQAWFESLWMDREEPDETGESEQRQ